MNIADKADIVILIVLVAWFVQSYRLATMRVKYKRSLQGEIDALKDRNKAKEALAAADELINDATATIDAATQIMSDYQKGTLKPSYQYRLKDEQKLKAAIEWPNFIEDKDK